MEMVVGSTTDGALGMLGCRSGYPARVSGVNPDVKKLHCMIHRYALCTKTLPPGLKSVLVDVVVMVKLCHFVNFVKPDRLNTGYCVCFVNN